MSISSKMDFNIVCFGSLRYYGEMELLHSTANSLMQAIEKKVTSQRNNIKVNKYIVTCKEDLNKIDDLNFAVIVPMSGAVQPLVITLAEHIKYMSVWASYIKGQSTLESEELTLKNNAAPALMDIYSVLKRTNNNVELNKNIDEIYSYYKAVNAVNNFKHSKLLVIGETEPWVISSCKDFNLIKEKFEIDVEQISLEDLYKIYNGIDLMEAEKLASSWEAKAEKIVEPSKEDLVNSAKLTIAFNQLVEKYKVDAIALACFQLLHDIGTTGCMALNMINDSLSCVASCEGDIDSALTLLLAKCVADKPAFMGNPNLQADGSVNFVHCTSAFKTSSNESDSFILRNHHESGIGVSPEVSLKTDADIISLRIGNNLENMTILKGRATTPIQETTCRTKIRIEFENPKEYIDTALGCHQVIVYDTDYDSFVKCANMLGLE